MRLDISKSFIGVELVEGIEDGHDGMVNGVQYFKARPGHGLLVRLASVLQKLTAAQLTYKIQEIIVLCAKRFAEYIEAVKERDGAIEKSRKEIYRLQGMIKTCNHCVNDASTSTARNSTVSSTTTSALQPPARMYHVVQKYTFCIFVPL